MKILAIDTSCMMGSVSITDEDQIIAEQMLNLKITHSERLIDSIDNLLKSSDMDIDQIDAFAVAIGPGSFTGLRISLGAVKGFAFSLNKPIVGISTLKALAYNFYASPYPIVSILDARRSEFYVSINQFDSENCVSLLEDAVMPPVELLKTLRNLKQKIIVVGDGVYKLKDDLLSELKENVIIPPPSLIHPNASNIAYLAMKRLATGDKDDPKTLSPNYIRKSDAEYNR